jgi:hypothetical protein
MILLFKDSPDSFKDMAMFFCTPLPPTIFIRSVANPVCWNCAMDASFSIAWDCSLINILRMVLHGIASISERCIANSYSK